MDFDHRADWIYSGYRQVIKKERVRMGGGVYIFGLVPVTKVEKACGLLWIIGK